MAGGLELGAELGEVLDDAVVHQRDPAVAAEVRVGVDVVGRAVGGPAGVPDAGGGAGQRRARRSPSRGWRACRRACRPARCVPSVDQRDAGGVVAAVLQPAQPLDHDVLRLLCHRRIPRFRTWRRSLRRRDPRRLTRLPAQTNPGPCRTAHEAGRRARESSPYVELDRAAWAALGQETESPLTAGRDRRAARPRRRARPRRGRAGLPPALPAAQPVRRVGGPAAPPAGGVPAPAAAAAHAVRDRPGGLGRGRQVDDRPRAAADAGALARAPQRRAGDDRRLPLPQRRARAPRPAAPQGVPRVLRPPGAAALRHRHQVRQGRGRGADVLPPRLRRRARREGRRSSGPTS